MIGANKGKEIQGIIEDYTMFDLETTGLDYEKDKIVEIGMVKVRSGQMIAEFSTLVDPECIIPPEVIKIHGITNEMAEGAPKIREALMMFNDFIGNDILLGQNIIRFDLPFIWNACKDFWNYTISNDYADNLTLARTVLPGAESHSLHELCKLFGIEEINCHRAVYDCKRTKAVYDKLIKLL